MADIEARREKVRQIAAAGGGAKREDEKNGAVVQEEEEEDEEVFIAFARIYSGVLKEGDQVYVLGPKHRPESALVMVEKGELPSHVGRAEIGPLYMMMGREMQRVEQGLAGNIIGKLADFE